MTKKRNQSPIVFASFDALKAIPVSGVGNFVWPNEGNFILGNWQFDASHIDKFKPYEVRDATAQAMLALHAGLNPASQVFFEDHVSKHRGYFEQLVDIAWKQKVKLDYQAKAS